MISRNCCSVAPVSRASAVIATTGRPGCSGSFAMQRHASRWARAMVTPKRQRPIVLLTISFCTLPYRALRVNSGPRLI